MSGDSPPFMVNSPPTISNITDASTDEDTATSAIAVTVDDEDHEEHNCSPFATNSQSSPAFF